MAMSSSFTLSTAGSSTTGGTTAWRVLAQLLELGGDGGSSHDGGINGACLGTIIAANQRAELYNPLAGLFAHIYIVCLS
jgi:hypothetical protein